MACILRHALGHLELATLGSSSWRYLALGPFTPQLWPRFILLLPAIALEPDLLMALA